MRTRTVTQRLELTLPPIATDTVDLGLFLANRFSSYADNHHQAIISGTSFAKCQAHYKKCVLDHAAAQFLHNARGIIDGLAMTTADGLGDRFCDETENNSIEHTTFAACTNMIAESVSSHQNTSALPNMTTQFIEVAKSSAESALWVSKTQRFASHCVLTAAHVTYQQGNSYASTLANIGDTTLIVYSPSDEKIKAILSPKIAYRGFQQWSPVAIQELVNEKMVSNLETKNIMLSSGDLIIQMTDGIWAGLPANKTQQTTADDKDIELDCESLEAILNKISGFSPALRFADALLHEAHQNLFKRRAELKGIADLLLPHKNRLLSIEAPLSSWLMTRPRTRLKVQLKKIIKKTTFTRLLNPDLPVNVVVEAISNAVLGDCGTINICRVPNRTDEVLRACLENDFDSDFLCEIIRTIPQPEANRSITNLAKELYIPRQEDEIINYGSKAMIPVYEASKIDDFQSIINLCYQLNQSVQQKKDQRATHQAILNTFTDKLPQKVFDTIITFLETFPKVTQDKKGFSLFKKTQATLQWQGVKDNLALHFRDLDVKLVPS